MIGSGAHIPNPGILRSVGAEEASEPPRVKDSSRAETTGLGSARMRQRERLRDGTGEEVTGGVINNRLMGLW